MKHVEQLFNSLPNSAFQLITKLCLPTRYQALLGNAFLKSSALAFNFILIP